MAMRLPVDDDFDDEDVDRWQLDAACRGEPVDAFYAESEGVPPEVAALCMTCEVRTDCFDHALRHETFGIWAGTTPKQRRHLRRVRGITLGPTADAVRAAELHDAGWDIAAIATELETTTRSVWRWLENVGQPVTPPQNWRRRPRNPTPGARSVSRDDD